MFDYPALVAVDAVVREGSFERGAKALGITPSAISQRVRGLEDRLGTILIRRGQPCVATAIGQTLCAHVAKVQLLEADLVPDLVPGFGATGRAAGASLTLKIAVNADSLATWFPQAMAAFADATGMSLDLILEDEGHTADRLRSGEVLAAVTADPEPVQGCKTIELGAMRYTACASPVFMQRYFADGVNPERLSKAPYLRFNRLDVMQASWVAKAHGVALAAPIHWVPSTQGFLDLAIAGLGWGVHPVALTRRYVDAGLLVELPPAVPVGVNLHWTVARLHATSLLALTRAVRDAATASFQA